LWSRDVVGFVPVRGGGIVIRPVSGESGRLKAGGASRVLLISANREQFPDPAFPLGPVYVASALQRKGVQIRILDAGLCWSPFKAVMKEDRRFSPDLIGLSLRNVDNVSYPCTRFYVPDYAEMVKKIRSVTSAPVILGGAGFSIFPEELIAAIGADGGLTGDGEAWADLLGEQLSGSRAAFLEDLGDVAFPRGIREIFPEFDRYRTVGVQTARGCPHRCTFCTYPMLEGARVRTRPPQLVAEEIARLHREHGKRDFCIVDSCFNADEKHMEKVCRAIIQSGVRIRFSCSMQPRMSDYALFELLARAGCTAIEFGVESGAPDMLASFRKAFSVEDLRTASSWCRRAGIEYSHSLIFGGPGESRDTIRETARVMDETAPRAVIAMVGVRVYPGTELERAARRDGSLGTDGSLLEPSFYFSGWEPRALLDEVRRVAETRENWFLPGRKDWSSFLWPKVLRFFHRKGPLWTAIPGEKAKAEE
jgi:radical SAM superfamily enzyme YgiQ (UPF0313 family)